MQQKKNGLNTGRICRIEGLASFKIIYQKNRNSQKIKTNKEFHSMLNLLKEKK